MILEALHELYDRLESDPAYKIAPLGYSLQKISFRVVLKPNGELLEIQDARQTVEGRSRPRQMLVPGKTKPSGPGMNPRFLWDTSQYMLGFKKSDKTQKQFKRTRDTHSSFVDHHLTVEEEIDSEPFSAVCRFLETWDPESAENHPVLSDAARKRYGVFQIQGETQYVHQDPAVATWWTEHVATESASSRGQCLVTGEEGPVARLHPKIKGVSGTKGPGGTIVGFKPDAFKSYGKDQSYNAPVAPDVAFRYTTALNALVDGPMKWKHRLSVGDMTMAFWTERPTVTEDIFAQFLSEGSQLEREASGQDEGLRQKVEAFLDALRRGRAAYAEIDDDPDQTAYFLLALAPNAGRISVRFFSEGKLGELLENLRRHHDHIAVGRASPRDPEFPSIRYLLDETCPRDEGGRPRRNRIPPILGGPLLKAVVTGSRYPPGLFATVTRRLHAGDAVCYGKVSVIKGYLNRNLNMEVTMSLDHETPEPSYRLGRLFAALEKTQKDALGENLNKTIGDTFYSSASATPRSVFPRLLRTYRHHLAKLEGGHRVNREKLVQEILDPLDGFPAHLGLADQGLFAIGYYHQTRNFYTKREKQEPENGGSDEPL